VKHLWDRLWPYLQLLDLAGVLAKYKHSSLLVSDEEKEFINTGGRRMRNDNSHLSWRDF
jgi:hypothetical protein